MTSQTKTGKFNKKISAAIIIVIIVLSLSAVAAQYMLAQSASNGNLPSMSITLIGSDGQQKILTEKDILALEPYTSKGGFKSSGGVIHAATEYTGVPVLTLCNLVGGLTNDQTVTVTASDGYTMVYTYDQVNGQDLTTYDPSTGSEKASTQPMKMVAIYFREGAVLTSEEVPLRIGFLGPEGLLTEGRTWVKMVSKIEVTANIKDWTVTVKATTNLDLDRQSYTADLNHNGINYTGSSGQVWTGNALWRWVSWSNKNGGVSNASLDSGYSVKIVSGDGSYATFDDSQVKMNNNIIIAGKLNGAVLSNPYWPLTLVGSDVPSTKQIKNIVQIRIILDSPSPTSSPSPSSSANPTPTPSPSPSPTTTPTVLPTMELTLVASNGTQIVLHASDMAALTSYTANGGTRNNIGELGNYGAYTGVPLLSLCNLVGGVTSSNAIRVTASDAYTTTYTYNQANGQGIATYDSSGKAVTPTQPLKVIVAYYLNGTALTSYDGPLRIITVGPEGYYTSGNLSARMVVKIEIL